MARTKTNRRINKRVKKSSMKKKHKRKSTKRMSLRGGDISERDARETIKEIIKKYPKLICDTYKQMKKENKCGKPSFLSRLRPNFSNLGLKNTRGEEGFNPLAPVISKRGYDTGYDDHGDQLYEDDYYTQPYNETKF